ncbi:aldehyde dehydrogenase family protein [Pontibacter sp. G13]|uniref:aldehyde dehydrogenase family protein n=1 Tax=Pontibacter sp. G13 TaxID=3074898 RepID=UPI00288B7D69|nr:aldehyde dehydrogenase family protein [Pontibacter sp. G13]WNJ20227.1 aldehyde dehydrogenase family protein [Pontibacter sp. G13]
MQTLDLPTNRQLIDIDALFDLQSAHQYTVGNTTAKERIAKLDQLHKVVMDMRPQIREALYLDYRKPPAEVDLTEIYVVTGEIKHAKRHLRKWMRPHRVTTPLAFMGASSHIRYEPKGVCLVIAPWNYPFQLALAPVISAIAAGNTVVLKPSEHSPYCSAILKDIVGRVFKPEEVAVVEGGVETSTALLAKPFNHIFFTGSPTVGKIVMEAAAKNLASVTLELGGKSPTIIDETANIAGTIKRLTWGKFSNCGQICIAPDYVFVHESRHDELVEALRDQLLEFYGADVSESDSYMRIINGNHQKRIASYLENAVQKGAKIAVGGRLNADQDFIEPTVVTDVPLDSALMTEEIFGPILPIIKYRDLNEVIGFINRGEKPLALYIYSRDKRNTELILKNTRAGGTCINNSDIHFFNNNLPFGGSNNSGLGKSHGWYGFESFSNARSVMRQHIPGALELLMPPYNGTKLKLIDLTIKWF